MMWECFMELYFSNKCFFSVKNKDGKKQAFLHLFESPFFPADYHVSFSVASGSSKHGVLHKRRVAQGNDDITVRNLILSVYLWLRLQIRLNVFSSTCRCDCTERLQSKLDYLRSELNDAATFKNIYRYAFDFARVSLFIFCYYLEVKPVKILEHHFVICLQCLCSWLCNCYEEKLE